MNGSTSGASSAGGNEFAFPVIDPSNEVSLPGMTLRDYFAAEAMPVELQASIHHRKADGMLVDDVFDIVAKYAYEMADAMLKARRA